MFPDRSLASGDQTPTPGRQLLDALFVEMNERLRRKASLLCRLDGSPSFSTADLVGDLYIKLSKNPAYSVGIAERDRLEFMRMASEAMRNILTDAARRRTASKRGGSFIFVSLSKVDQRAELSISPELLIDLDDALQVLEEKHPRRAAILKMRFYSGLTTRELQQYWGLGDASVERDIHLSLKLLHTLLHSELD